MKLRAGLGAEPSAAMTPTFTPPDVTGMRTYELMATPLVYPSQTLQARVVANSENARDVTVSLRADAYGEADALDRVRVDAVALAPGEETLLDWRLPDTGGEPIQAVGRRRPLCRQRPGRRDNDRLAAVGGPTCGSTERAASERRFFSGPRRSTPPITS